MNIVVIVPALLALHLSVAADPTLKDLAPHAAGVALVEVLEAKEYDMRPADGNKGVEFKLKRLSGTGAFRDSIHVVTAHGGLRAPGSKPRPSRPLGPDSLKKGNRYWVAFASHGQWISGEHNQGIITTWPEKEPKVAEVLESAVKADALGWFPEYDPRTGVTYGYVEGEKQWRVRVEKGDKLLWERVLPGKRTEGYFAWGLWGSTGTGFPAKLPPSKQLLVALSTVELEGDNEFGLEAKRYHVRTIFDPETGRRYAALVAPARVGLSNLVEREYDPESGKMTREDRFDSVKTGGKALGAKSEEWSRKTSRTYDPATGKVTKEESFWYNPDAEHDKRWVKLPEKK